MRCILASLLLLAVVAVVTVNAAPSPDNGAHPYVGIAYRYVPSLSGYVVCSGSLVNLPSLASSSNTIRVFVTSGQCIAYGSGNGEQFQITFSQSPRFTRDAETGQITQIDTEVSYSGVGYTEYRLDHAQEDAARNFGFITLNLEPSVAAALGTGPSFPAQVGAFSSTFEFPKGDFTPLITVGYGLSDDGAHILGDRRTNGVKQAVVIKDVISAKLSPVCFLGQSGTPLLADGVLYGVSTMPTITPTTPMSAKALYSRTDSAAFQDLLSRVLPLINP